MAKEAKDQSQTQQLSRTSAQDYKALYANASFTSISLWDIQVTFSRITTTSSGREHEDAVTIIQSPTHAKAFLRLFSKMVAAYEEKLGPIPEEQEISAPTAPTPALVEDQTTRGARRRATPRNPKSGVS